MTPQLTLPPQIRVSILRNYQRVFQFIDSRLPRDLYYIVSFSQMLVNTAAILSDSRGNQYQHGWCESDLDKVKTLGLFKDMSIHYKDDTDTDISRVFLYDVDMSVDYDYINWMIAGNPYASYAGYTTDNHEMEDKLLTLKNKLELTDSDSLDTFHELFDSELSIYLKYIDLTKTCEILLLEDIHRLKEEAEKV